MLKSKHKIFNVSAIFTCALITSELCAESLGTQGTISNRDFFASPRAEAMSGAISTSANGMDSLYYNPAAIGGIFWGSKKPPAIRQLYFPFIGVSANNNSQKLWNRLSEVQADSNPDAAEALIDDNQDKRQYARVTSGVYTEIFRTAILLNSDLQFSAVNSSENTKDPRTDSNTLNVNYESTSISGFGVSGSTSDESLYFGVFIAQTDKTIYDDQITYKDLINIEARENILSSNSTTYEGIYTTAGMLMKLDTKTRSVLSLVARGVGETALTYKSGKTPSGGLTSGYELGRDITAGYSITPRVFGGELSWSLDLRYLNLEDIELEKKVFTALEYTLGGVANDAFLAIRLGASPAGMSSGLKVGTGLLNFEVSMAKVLSSDSEKLTFEDRRTIQVYVNVRDM